jgi:Ca2+-binding RTX toxin-like protein
LIDNSTDASSAGKVSVVAQDDSSIWSFAGALGISLKESGLGAAFAWNEIDNTVEAKIENSTLPASSVTVTAEMKDTEIWTLSIGAAGTKNTAIAGSFSVNFITSTVDAHISNNANIDTTGNVEVKAIDKSNIFSLAGQVAISISSSAIGAAVGVNRISNTIKAYIDNSNVDTTDNGNVIVSADEQAWIKSLSVGASMAGSSFALGGSVSINLITNTIEAKITGTKAINAHGSILVSAFDDTDSWALAGNFSLGSSNAVGISNVTLITNNDTKAYIGENADVTAKGSGNGVSAYTGSVPKSKTSIMSKLLYEVLDLFKTPGAKASKKTETVKGLAVVAASFEDYTSFAVGGTAAGSNGVAGSATISVLNEDARAAIDKGAKINIGGNPAANNGESVVVRAIDQTNLFGLAGAIAAGGSTGVGAGIDVAVITKDTIAIIDAGATVTANRDVKVEAISSEDISSMAASIAIGGSNSLAAGLGVSVFSLTTRASIEGSPGGTVVNTGGSILVAAQDQTFLDIIAGNFSASGSAALGGAAAVPIIIETIEAYIGDGVTVNAKGTQPGIKVNTGTFDEVLISDPSGNLSEKEGEVPRPKVQNNQSTDPKLTSERYISPGTIGSFKGVAVTAINIDEIETYAVGIGASGSVAAQFSANVNVLTNTTTAYIDDNALVNQDRSGVGGDQSVLVAAGNDYYFMGIAGGIAGSGEAALTPGVGAAVIVNTVEAYIGQSAQVDASDDVLVVARANEVFLIVSGAIAGAGQVAGAGTITAIVMVNETHAYIDQNAVVDAGATVLVAASDETEVDSFTGAISGALYFGAGAGIGVIVLDKDTYAWIAAGADVTALGNSPGGLISYNGELDSSGKFGKNNDIHGLIVEAYSSEDVWTMAIAGGGGAVGLAGAVTVTVLDSDTVAYIDGGADVNLDNTGAGDKQDIYVSAVNDVDLEGRAGGLSFGAGGLAGAIDIGIIRNDTTAYIASPVKAKRDVHVNAAANREIDSFTLSIGLGGLSIAGAVNVYSIGGNLEGTYSSEGKSGDALKGSDNSTAGGWADSQTALVKKSTMLKDHNDPSHNSGSQNTSEIRTRVAAADATVSTSTTVNSVETSLAKDVEAEARTLPRGTSAFIADNITVDAGRHVDIDARERIELDMLAGGVSVGGAAGIGAGIGITTFDTPVTAFIGASTVVDAGGDVSVDANLRTTVDVKAFVGAAGGGITLGAAVAIVDDESDVSASIATGTSSNPTKIRKAKAVYVRAETRQEIDVLAPNVTLALAGSAAGATIVTVDLTGATKATIGDYVYLGQAAGNKVGSVAVTATGVYKADLDGWAVAAGPGTLTANVVLATINPIIQASIGLYNLIYATGYVSVRSNVEGDVNVDTYGVSIGFGGAAGASISTATLTPDIDTFIGSNTSVNTSSGDVTVKTTYNAIEGNGAAADAWASGGSGGLSVNGAVATATDTAEIDTYIGNNSTIHAGGNIAVSTFSGAAANAEAGAFTFAFVAAIGASIAIAKVETDITTSIQSNSSLTTTSGSVTVETRHNQNGSRFVKAKAKALGGGLYAAGNGADATAVNSVDVTTYLSSSVTIIATNDVSIRSTVESGETIAETKGISVSGGLAVGVSLSTATAKPELDAYIGDNSSISTSGGKVIVESIDNANSKATKADAVASGGGLLAGNGAESIATAAGEVDAYVGRNTTIFAGGRVTIKAAGYNNAQAVAESINIGGLAVGILYADADAHGYSRAELENNVTITWAGALIVEADNTNYAYAEYDLTNVGLISGTGGDAQAIVPNTASVKALVGQNVTVNSSDDIEIKATSLAEADAIATGASGGAVNVSASDASARVETTVTAEVGSNSQITTSNGSVTVAASNGKEITTHDGSVVKNDNVTSTYAKSAGGGLVDVKGADTRSTVEVDVRVVVGDNVTIKAGKNLSITSLSAGNATAESAQAGGGAVAVGAGEADVDISNTNKASVGISADFTAGENFTLLATTFNFSRAEADSAGGGAVADGDADAHIKLAYDTRTIVGVNSKINAANKLTLQAQTKTDTDADAESDTGGVAADSSGDASVKIGDSSTAVTETLVSSNVELTGKQVLLAAKVPLLKANVSGSSEAGGGIVDSDGTGVLKVNERSRVTVSAGAQITGTEKIEVKAEQTIDTKSRGEATLYGAAGDTDATAENDTKTNATITAAATAKFTTWELTVLAQTTIQQYDKDADRTAYALDFGDESEPGSLTPVRDIVFDADALIRSAPKLVVESNGDVSATLLSANGSQKSGRLGLFVSVDDFSLNNNTNGGISLTANKITHADNKTKSKVTGSSSTIEFAFEDIVISNASSMPLIINKINAIYDDTKQDIATADLTTGFSYTVTDTVFTETKIDILNTGASDIELKNEIYNPMARTIIRNTGTGGDILSKSAAAKIRTRDLQLVSEKGSIGTSTDRIKAELIQHQANPAVLNATASGNIYLDLTARQRSTNPFKVEAGTLKAGGSVDLLLQTGTKESSKGVAGDKQASTFDFTTLQSGAAGNIIINSGDYTETTALVHVTGSIELPATVGALDVDVNGNIDFTEKTGAILVNEARSRKGTVTLTTPETSAISENIVIPSGKSVKADSKYVTLRAGDDVTINGSFAAKEASAIYIDYNNADAAVNSVANFNYLDGIAADITVYGMGTTDTVNFDDTFDSDSEIGDLKNTFLTGPGVTLTTLTGLGMDADASISIDRFSGKIEYLNVRLGSGSNVLTLRGTTAITDIDLGDGTDRLDAGPGASEGAAGITGELNDQTITGMGGLITYNSLTKTTVEELWVTLAAGVDLFTIKDTESAIPSTLNGGPGNDTLIVEDSSGVVTVYGGDGLDYITFINAGGVTTLNGDNSDDNVNTNPPPSCDPLLTTCPGDDRFYIQKADGNLTVNGGVGADKYFVSNTVSPTTFTVGGVYDDSDPLSLMSGDLSTVTGTLYINGNADGNGGYKDRLFIYPGATTTNGLLNNAKLTGLTMAGSGAIQYGTVEELHLRLGAAGDIFTIYGVPTGTTVTVNGSDGDDVVNVGNAAGLLNEIDGSVIFHGDAGSDRLNAHNEGDTADCTADPDLIWACGQLTAIALSGLGMGSSSLSEWHIFHAIQNPDKSISTSTEQVHVYLGSGDDKFFVDSTYAYGTGYVHAGDGDDTIRVESTAYGLNPASMRRVDFIAGPVYLDGEDGNDFVILNDMGDDIVNSGTFENGAVTGLGITGSVRFTDTSEQLEVDLGAQNDSFYVRTTPSWLTTRIKMGEGFDTTYVGSGSNSLDDILGPLYIEGELPYADDVLFVNDYGDSSDNTYTISSENIGVIEVPDPNNPIQTIELPVNETTIQRTGAAVIKYQTVEKVSLNTGAGDDTVNLLSTHLELDPLEGNNSVFVINGGDGDDEFYLDNNQSMEDIDIRVIVDGAGGSNSVFFDHSASTEANTLAFIGKTFADLFSERTAEWLASVSDLLGDPGLSNTDVFASASLGLVSDPSTQVMELDVNVRNAQLAVLLSDADDVFRLSGAYAMSLRVDGGGGNDTFNVSDDVVADQPITLNGDDGDDVLFVDFSMKSPTGTNSLINFNGGNHDVDGDLFRVAGDGVSSGSYTPSSTVSRAGTVVINGFTFTFTGLEPLIVHGLAGFSVNMPDAVSDLAIETLDLADMTLPNLVLHNVTVDGVISWRQQFKLAGINSPEPENYGQALAYDGKTLVVGANRVGQATGVAFVYERVSDNWSEVAKLYPDDILAGGGKGFGAAVAVDDDVLVVGAPNDDNYGPNTGALYVYRQHPTTKAWEQEYKVRGPSSGYRLGDALDLGNDTILAGMPKVNRAYTYTYAGASAFHKWVFDQSFTGAGNFGTSVALGVDGSEMTAVIGAPGADKVHIYDYNGSAWSSATILAAPDGGSATAFGTAVDTNATGSRIVVGAPNYDSSDVTPVVDKGAAWIYDYDNVAGEWALSARLTADGGLPDDEATSEGKAGDHFGASVSMYGSYVAVGAPDYDGNSTEQGKAYVFYYHYLSCGGACDADIWTRSHNLSSSSPAENEYFGAALVLGDKLLVVGVPGYNDTDVNNNIIRESIGNIRTYTTTGSIARNDFSNTSTGLYRAEVLSGGVNFGRKTFYDKDENELIISAYGENKVYIYTSQDLYWIQKQVLSQTSGSFGYDMDWDDDRLVIGAPEADKVYVYERGTSGWELKKTIDGPTGVDSFGAAVAVDGSRIAIGAPDTAMWYSSHGQPVDDYKLQLGKTGVVITYTQSGGSWSVEEFLMPWDPGMYFGDTTFEIDGITYTIQNHDAFASSYAGQYTPDGPKVIVIDNDDDLDEYSFTLNNYAVSWVQGVNDDLHDDDKSVIVWPKTCAVVWNSNDGSGEGYLVCNDSFDNASRETELGKGYVDAVLVFNGADKYIDPVTGTEYTPGAFFNSAVDDPIPLNRVMYFDGPELWDLHNFKYGLETGGPYYDLSEKDTSWTLNPYSCAAVLDDSGSVPNDTVIYCNGTASQVHNLAGTNNVDYLGVFAYTDNLGVIGRTKYHSAGYTFDGLKDAAFGNTVELNGNELQIGASGKDKRFTATLQGAIYGLWDTPFSGADSTDQYPLPVGVMVGTTYNLGDATDVYFDGGNFTWIDAYASYVYNGAYKMEGDPDNNRVILTAGATSTLTSDGSVDKFGHGVSYINTGQFVVGTDSAGKLFNFRQRGPLWTYDESTIPDRLPTAKFGTSVGVDVDTAVVGAPEYDGRGAAFIFVKDPGAETWSLEDRIEADGSATGDDFGSAVAISQSRVIIGAPEANSGKGAAYVFERVGATWHNRSLPVPAGLSGNADFGAAVDIYKQNLVVGAPGINKVYIYNRNTGVWVQADVLNGSGEYGRSVGLDETTLVVGAPATGGNIGAASVYAYDGLNWISQAALAASDGIAGDRFGTSVDVTCESTLCETPAAIVGAPGDDSGRGAAYTYAAAGSVWSQQQKLAIGGFSPDDSFGWSVAIDGKRLVVGAYKASVSRTVGGVTSTTPNEGAAYAFGLNEGSWQLQTVTKPLYGSDAFDKDYFGYSVALSGTIAVSGAPQLDGRTGTAIDTDGAGYIHVTDLSPPLTVTKPAVVNVVIAGGKANNIDGTVGGLEMTEIDFFDIASFTLDTDAGTHDDAVRLGTNGLKAEGLQHFTISTGPGEDVFTIQTSDLSLPTDGKFIPGDLSGYTEGAALTEAEAAALYSRIHPTFTYNGGVSSSTDEVIFAVDDDLTLTNNLLSSSGSGQLQLTLVNLVRLTTGPSDNLLKASGWAGSVVMEGNGGEDHYTLDLSSLGSAVITDSGINPEERDDLTVLGSESSDTITLDGTVIAVGARTIDMASSGIELVSIVGRGGNDSFVVGAISLGEVTLDGLDGADTYTLNVCDSSDTVVFISDTSVWGDDTLRINGSAGNDTLSVGAAQTVCNDTVFINYDDTVETFTVDAGAGNDNITVNGHPTSIYGIASVYGGTGDDTLLINDIGKYGMTLDGGLDSDSYRVAGSLSGTLTGSDSGGTDYLFIDGTSGNDNVVLYSNQITVNGSTAYSFSSFNSGAQVISGLEGVNIDLLGGSDSISVVSIPIDVAVAISGGLGDDAFVLNNLASLYGVGALYSLRVYGNEGSGDTLTLDASGNGTGSLDEDRFSGFGLSMPVYYFDPEGFTASLDLTTGDDNITVSGSKGVWTVAAQAGTDTLTADGPAKTWNITANDAGNIIGSVGSLYFSSVENLTGGSNDDTFIYSEGVGISGSVDGKGGKDTLDLSSHSASRHITLTVVGSVDGFDVTEVTLGSGFYNMNGFVGTSSMDTLVGADIASTWNITAVNTGNINGSFAFTDVEQLIGGNNTDILDFSTFASARNVLLTGEGSVDGFTGTEPALSASFDNMNGMVGAAAASSDSLAGTNHINTWNVTDVGKGSLSNIKGAFSFNSVERLIGNNDTDTLDFSGFIGSARSVTLTGVVSGEYAGTEAALAAGFDKMNGVIGSGGNDALTGMNIANIWGVTADNTGKLNGTFSFSSVEQLNGGSSNDILDLSAFSTTREVTLRDVGSRNGFAGREASLGSGFDNMNILIGTGASDTLIGADFDNTWNITGSNAGNISNIFAFVSIEKVTGGDGTDILDFSILGSARNVILTSAGSVDGFDGTEDILGSGFDNMDGMVGTSFNDTLRGAGIANTWNITDNNTGNINEKFTFNSVERLIGSSGPGSSDILNFSTFSSLRNVTLTTGGSQDGFAGTEDALANGFDNMNGLVGTTSSDVLKGVDIFNTWFMTAANTGNISGLFSFSSIERLIGGTAGDILNFSGYGSTRKVILTNAGIEGWAGTENALDAGFDNFNGVVGSGEIDDTLVGISIANVWNILNKNAGNIGGGFTFNSIEHLTGGSDSDVIDFSAYGSGRSVTLKSVGLDGFAGIEDSLSSGFDNMNSLVGTTAYGDALEGANITNIWNITNNNVGNISNLFPFTSIESLIGGNEEDTFILADGVGVSGTINGGAGGANTLDYSAFSSVNPVIVNLVLGLATATTSISNIIHFIGGAGDDLITGNNENNQLTGGGGDDTLTGGLGDDTYFFADGWGNDTLIELAAGGQDTVNFEALTTSLVLTLASTLNVVDGLGSTLDHPSNGIEIVIAGLAVDNFIVLSSFTGTSIMNGFESIDTIDFSDFTIPVTLDMTVGTATATGVFITMISIEKLVGGAGNDTLISGPTDEVLVGGAGDDLFIFSDNWGNDIIFEYNGEGKDTISFSAAGVELIFTLGSLITTDNFGNTATYLGDSVEVLIGGAGDDLIKFGLDGVAFAGGLGTIDGGGGINTLDYSVYTTGVVVDLGLGIATGTAGVSNIRHAIGGSGADVLIGDGLDNQLTGNAGNDILSGADGNDNLLGSADNDVLNGGTGTDILSGGDGTDTLNGGEGDDDLNGNAGSDLLNGGSGFDTLTDLEGNNTLNGDAGNDQLTTGNGNDILNGGSGEDILKGGDGNDILSGNSGNDTIYSGLGNDTLAGGADDDLYLFQPGFGNDTLLETGGSDTLDFTAITADLNAAFGANLSITDGVSTLSQAGQPQIEVLLTGSGDDRFEFSQNAVLNGRFDAGSGNDKIDYSGYASGRNVTLQSLGDVDGFAGVAATISGGFNNIDDLVGSGFVDTLNGMNVVSDWEIDGTNEYTGSGRTLGFNSFENLQGGSVDDHFLVDGNQDVSLFGNGGLDEFEFVNSAVITGVTNGGSGNDLLNFSGYAQDSTFTLTQTGSTGGFNGAVGAAAGGFAEIDTLIGSSASNDILVGMNAASTWELDGSNRYLSGGNSLAFSSIGSVRGGSVNDVFQVSASQDINLEGGSGADQFVFTNEAVLGGRVDGGSGADSFDFSNYVTYQSVYGYSVLMNLATGEASFANQGVADSVEIVVGSIGNDNLVGGAHNVVFYGGPGNDRLTGGSGNDILFGGDGVDTLSGGPGSDKLSGGAGIDYLDGGAGSDTYIFEDDWGLDVVGANPSEAGQDTMDYSALSNGLMFFLDGGAARDGENIAGQTVHSISQITGSRYNDTFIASDEMVNYGLLVNGGGGINTLSYSGSTTRITIDFRGGQATNFGGFTGIANGVGGAGDDTFISGPGSNIINGGPGNDIIICFANYCDDDIVLSVERITLLGLTVISGSETFDELPGVLASPVRSSKYGIIFVQPGQPVDISDHNYIYYLVFGNFAPDEPVDIVRLRALLYLESGRPLPPEAGPYVRTLGGEGNLAVLDNRILTGDEIGEGRLVIKVGRSSIPDNLIVAGVDFIFGQGTQLSRQSEWGQEYDIEINVGQWVVVDRAEHQDISKVIGFAVGGSPWKIRQLAIMAIDISVEERQVGLLQYPMEISFLLNPDWLKASLLFGIMYYDEASGEWNMLETEIYYWDKLANGGIGGWVLEPTTPDAEVRIVTKQIVTGTFILVSLSQDPTTAP